MHIPIIFENEDFLAVNKPVGLGMHQRAHNSRDGICQLIQSQTKLDQLYLVHRLDTPTSGCLLLAKHKDAARAVNAKFESHQIVKYYLAISDKKPSKKQGKVIGMMAKSRSGSYKLLPKSNKTDTASTMQATSPAITYFFNDYIDGTGRIFYIKPLSGKTHQIRVALKSLGSPILGDIRYKGAKAERLYLHSHKLSFEYMGQTISLSCLPETDSIFTSDVLSMIKQPESLNWPSSSRRYEDIIDEQSTKDAFGANGVLQDQDIQS